MSNATEQGLPVAESTPPSAEGIERIMAAVREGARPDAVPDNLDRARLAQAIRRANLIFRVKCVRDRKSSLGVQVTQFTALAQAARKFQLALEDAFGSEDSSWWLLLQPAADEHYQQLRREFADIETRLVQVQ